MSMRLAVAKALPRAGSAVRAASTHFTGPLESPARAPALHVLVCFVTVVDLLSHYDRSSV